MRKWLGLLLFPLVAQAAGEGELAGQQHRRDPQQPWRGDVVASAGAF